MSMIRFESDGSFEKTKKFLNSSKQLNNELIMSELTAIAEQGVAALSAATPVRTGATASAWGYEIERTSGKTTITWTNDNIVNGANIAILLQYGHGTRNGGYVIGMDYINPALRPIFDQMTESMWKAVVSI